MESLYETVVRWSRDVQEDPEQTYLDSYELIVYLSKTLFLQYIPTIGPSEDFEVRLEAWVQNVASEADQKLLFNLVAHIAFVAREDFEALYRSTFNGPILRALIDIHELGLSDITESDKFAEVLRTTWFCPITDSMDIANFYHANRLEGRNYRPSWATLRRFGNARKIQCYLKQQEIKTIVLLEDFVGSGSQAASAVRFCAKNAKGCHVLVAPLLTCPAGSDRFSKIATKYSQVEFIPGFELPGSVFVTRTQEPQEPPFNTAIRALAQSTYLQVSGGQEDDLKIKPYGPFGFADTGALVVTYSNTPDNTLPLIHNSSLNWRPLFPRSARI